MFGGFATTEEHCFGRATALELRAVHHQAAATLFATTDQFAFFLDDDCAADRTDNPLFATSRDRLK
jgi:hypothetical protein